MYIKFIPLRESGTGKQGEVYELATSIFVKFSMSTGVSAIVYIVRAASIKSNVLLFVQNID